MNPFTRFVQEMLRKNAQHPDTVISDEARRVLEALEQGKRATRRPMPQPKVDKQSTTPRLKPEACSCGGRDAQNTHRVWRIDCRPTPNIERRIHICVGDVPAGCASESGLIRPVGARRMPTRRTLLRRVAGVHKDDRHACALCLVGDVCAKLRERPTVQLIPSPALNRYPLPDALQILKGDAPVSVFRLLDQLFRDAVVHVIRKAPFLPGQLLQSSLGRLRAFRLQLAAQAAVTVAHVEQVASAVYRVVTVGEDVSHSHVRAKKPLRVNRRFVGQVAGRVQVELTAAIHEVALTPLELQQFKVRRTSGKWNGDSPAQCPNADLLSRDAPVEDAVIVGNRAVRPERAPCAFVQLVGVRHLADTANGHLRRQFEAFTDGVVSQVVERNATECFGFPRLPANPVASGIGAFQHRQQRAALVISREKLYYRSQFHTVSVAHLTRNINALKGAKGLSLPTAKAGGISPRF